MKNWKLLQKAYKFKPWDYGFMLDLERACYEQMIPYYEKYGHLVNHEEVARDLKLAIKLIDIITEDDVAYDMAESSEVDKWQFYLTKYINTKNSSRFGLSKLDQPVLVNGLRVKKALYLYHKLRYYKLRTWWD